MNPINTLRRANARMYSAELTAAAWLDVQPRPRRAMLRWAHAGATPVVFCIIGPIDMAGAVALHAKPAVVAAIAVVSLACVAVSRIAAKAHQILDEDERPCPYCPARDDRGGDGGIWLDYGSFDIPPAPAPMPDYDDEQYREWAADIDGQLLNLVADTRRAETGDAL